MSDALPFLVQSVVSDRRNRATVMRQDFRRPGFEDLLQCGFLLPRCAPIYPLALLTTRAVDPWVKKGCGVY